MDDFFSTSSFSELNFNSTNNHTTESENIPIEKETPENSNSNSNLNKQDADTLQLLPLSSLPVSGENSKLLDQVEKSKNNLFTNVRYYIIDSNKENVYFLVYIYTQES